MMKERRNMDLSYITDKAYRLYLLLAYARDEMFKARNKELATYAVLPTQSSVLMAISRLGDKATPTAISHLIPRDSQTICGILNRMEKQELVKRV
jgi:DNA-binding MarR family transcriptional regulator